jgi:hypothetical protein
MVCLEHQIIFNIEDGCRRCIKEQQNKEAVQRIEDTYGIKPTMRKICNIHGRLFDDDGSCDECLAEQKKNPIEATVTIEKHRKEITERPPHYNQGKIEVSDFIEDQDLPWAAENVIKYICRYRYKGDPMGDLMKAEEYIKRQIRLVEREGKDE